MKNRGSFICKLLTSGCLVACLLTFPARAQSPIGPVFPLDPESPVAQYSPDLQFDETGKLWFVWLNSPSTEFDQVKARAMSPQGVLSPVWLLVDTSDVPATPAEIPLVAPLSEEGILLIYSRVNGDGLTRVHGKRFDAAGQALGGQSTLSPPAPAAWSADAVAPLPDGRFMLLADGRRCLTCSRINYSVYGRVFSPDGSPAGNSWRAPNQPANSLPGVRSLAVDGQGNAIFVWTHESGDFYSRNYSEVHGRRFSSTGEPIGREFAVNTRSRGAQYLPSVAADAEGNFVVVWQYRTPGGAFRAILGQRFSKTGEKIGPEFRIDSGDRRASFAPVVAMDRQGNFVVVWSSPSPPAPQCVQVLARLFRPDGQPVGSEFPVAASRPAGCGENPKVAFGPQGMFAVAWTSYVREEAEVRSVVYATRFSVPPAN
jgi:hypothetical protein